MSPKILIPDKKKNITIIKKELERTFEISSQIARTRWANGGKWLAWLANGWRGHVYSDATLVQRNLTNRWCSFVDPTLGQRN